MISGDPARRKAYVPELDGVRGIAIAGVMALHFIRAITPTNAIERTAVKISGYGGWGVDLFFVLSGFLITGILLDSKGSSQYLRSFYARRVLRIFPLYYAVLFVLFVLVMSPLARFDPQLLEMQRLQGWVWPYLTNVYLGSQETFSIPYISHFWTLAIEEHFYLVWPFVILLLTRRAAMRTCILLGLLSLALRIAFLATTPNLLYWQVLTPCRLDALCAGAWFALSAHGRDALEPERAMRWLRRSGVAIIALSFWHILLRQPEALIVPLKMTVLAIFFGAFIYAVPRHPGLSWARTGLRASWLRTLGKYSYGLYVYHGIVSYAIDRHPPEFLYRAVGLHTVAAGLQVAFGVTLSLLLAVVSFEFFEARFLALKKRFDYATAPGRPRHEQPTVALLTGFDETRAFEPLARR